MKCPCGSPCIHRDQAFGIRQTSGKMESDWRVSVTRENVNLISSEMLVTMERTAGE